MWLGILVLALVAATASFLLYKLVDAFQKAPTRTEKRFSPTHDVYGLKSDTVPYYRWHPDGLERLGILNLSDSVAIVRSSQLFKRQDSMVLVEVWEGRQQVHIYKSDLGALLRPGRYVAAQPN